MTGFYCKCQNPITCIPCKAWRINVAAAIAVSKYKWTYSGRLLGKTYFLDVNKHEYNLKHELAYQYRRFETQHEVIRKSWLYAVEVWEKTTPKQGATIGMCGFVGVGVCATLGEVCHWIGRLWGLIYAQAVK